MSGRHRWCMPSILTPSHLPQGNHRHTIYLSPSKIIMHITNVRFCFSKKYRNFYHLSLKPSMFFQMISKVFIYIFHVSNIPSTLAEFVPWLHRFQKAFDRVWHAALWATMRKYNLSANLVRAIEHLYDKAISAVQINGSTGKWCRMKFGMDIFNIFLERIMSDALEEHDENVSIGGRTITDLRFADDIDALATRGPR